jgi:hypothetical protein
MRTVQVNVHIAAPIEQVFDAVSDHERFLLAADGTKTKLLREGAAERNAVGCVREVTVGSGLLGARAANLYSKAFTGLLTAAKVRLERTAALR